MTSLKLRVSPPRDDEDYEDFMERCTQDEDEETCDLMWEESSVKSADDIIRRARVTKGTGFDFVLSDESEDRMDEIIMSDGWELDEFKSNPIALFGHNPDFIIGNWKNVRVEKKKLLGTFVPAPDGTSERIDEISRLVKAGVLRAASVGFKPKKKEPMDDKSDPYFGPFRYLRQKLMETSLVSVPANPNALAVAKSMKVSPEGIKFIFAGKGKGDDLVRREGSGGKAKTIVSMKGATHMSLSQRVQDAEKRLVELRGQLQEHIDSIDDTDVTDEEMDVTRDFNEKIAKHEKSLAILKDTEKNLAQTADDGGRSLVPFSTRKPASPNGGNGASGEVIARESFGPRPFNFNIGRKQMDPIDILVRMGVVQLLSHREKKPIEEIRRAVYGEDEVTRVMMAYTAKAATVPATTALAGWAQELVTTLFSAYMATLPKKSIYPRLSAAGLQMSFGTAGKISIPTRSTTPTIAGSFVGEGLPIPVRQGAFTAQTLTPKKMAVITCWTREIDEHSVPQIEGLLRDAIAEDTAVSMDAVLIDATAATVIRPAGILAGVAGLTPTAGGGFAALVGDIKQISGALLTATNGNLRNPVWLMNPQQVMSASLTQATGTGVFPFQDQINRGQLQGWPIIDSGSVPIGDVIAMDAGDFVSVGGDSPRFEISDQATIHMEDTNPLAISTAGTPNVVAAPVRSLWQTDSMALRLILPVNWMIRRPGVVAWVDNVSW